MDAHVILKHSDRARRLALRLDTAKACIHLIVPRDVSLTTAYAFARDKENWIRKVLKNFPTTPTPFAQGTIVPLCGQNVAIEVERSTKGASRVRIEGDILHVRLASSINDPAPVIERFLCTHARSVLGSLVRQKGSPTAFTVREMTSRWGSCSANGRIALSWRLILAPIFAMDYVAAHEAAHLTHMNHSPAFWDLCRALSVDFESGKAWIKAHGRTLLRWGTM